MLVPHTSGVPSVIWFYIPLWWVTVGWYIVLPYRETHGHRHHNKWNIASLSILFFWMNEVWSYIFCRSTDYDSSYGQEGIWISTVPWDSLKVTCCTPHSHMHCHCWQGFQCQYPLKTNTDMTWLTASPLLCGPHVWLAECSPDHDPRWL